MERIEGEGKRPSKREAVAHQSYATAREGRSFSEQASPEAYAEAEMFVEQLKRPEFNWLGIDWDKIDLRKIEDIEDVERRLDTAVRIAMEKNDSKLTVRDFLKKHKSVLGFAMSVGLLLSPACSRVDRAQYEKNIAERDRVVEKAKKAHVDGLVLAYELGREQEFGRYIDFIEKWKEGHPELGSITLDAAKDNGEKGDKEFRFFASVTLRSVDGGWYNAYAATGDSIEGAITVALEKARQNMSKERTSDARRWLK